MRRLPVIAAIPNYNMGEQLVELLPQVVEGGYDQIFVLDDASTDGSREIVEALGMGVRFIGAAENKGAGAARNLIIGQLAHRSLIHFIDADTDLITDNPAEVIQDIMPSEVVGFVGGLALTTNGLQNIWNYGPRQSLRTAVGANIIARSEGLLSTNPDRVSKIREHLSDFLAEWPDPLALPERRQVFWNIEQNLVFDSSVFEVSGGFDETLREHEIQDLAIRLYGMGLKRYFDPALQIVHKAVDVRHYNRAKEMIKAEYCIAKKHGITNWFMPGGKFKPEL